MLLYKSGFQAYEKNRSISNSSLTLFYFYLAVNIAVEILINTSLHTKYDDSFKKYLDKRVSIVMRYIFLLW